MLANRKHVNAVTEGGGEYVGVMPGTLDGERLFDDLILFNSPKTGSTLALPEKLLTPEAVRCRIIASNKLFNR